MAHSAELESRFHSSLIYKDTQGEKHELPPVRIFVRHSASLGESCDVSVGKSDFLGLFNEEESFHCVSDGARIFVSRDFLSKILERSLFYSIRFSRENELDALMRDFRSTGKVSKLSEKDDAEILKKLQSWFSKALGDLTQVHSFSHKDETEFRLKIPGVTSEFQIKLEFVKMKGTR